MTLPPPHRLGLVAALTVGLALIFRLAPARIVSMMMGIWFAATLPADILAGFLGGYWSSMPKPGFFLMTASIAALAGVAFRAFQRSVSKA